MSIQPFLTTTESTFLNETPTTNKTTQIIELKNQVEFFHNISCNFDAKNKDLQKTNRELETQKTQYKKIKDELIHQVNQKSRELAKSAKMAAIGNHSSSLVHDLRNPLAVIQGTIELLKLENQDLNSKTSEKFLRIENAINKISLQIEDVLSFVRESELHLEKIPVSNVIESAISNIDIPSGIRIKKEFCDVTINCDSRKLESVFSNLITNAIQAMNKNGEIKLKIQEHGRNTLIQISDTGPGVPESDIDKIFEHLFTTKKGGTGLGLSICKTIIEQHGGAIKVTNAPTTFTIVLPRK